jgi:YidC/Oxa1 family membrane protein insertase
MFDAIFVKPLINILFFIYGVIPGHDFGVSVILLTVLIRFVMWPVMAKQLHSQKKMQALQPEIARVRAEAGGDKQKESAMLMELYKQKEINPLASCLPLVIQLPFLLALFAVFNRATQGFDVVAPLLYEPVKNLAWIQQVINNPSLFSAELFGVVDLAAKNNIVLALIAGATQYYQVWQITPKQTDPSDPSAAMNKMMTWMFPLLTAWIGYTLVAALPLYWTVSNGVSILQQTLTMKEEVDKMEEAKVVTKVRETQALTGSKKTKGKAKTKRKRG